MAKKKTKKNPKQVETASPPDSAPAPPTEEPIPETPAVLLTEEVPTTEHGPEGQPPAETPATEIVSGEQSVPSLPKVETIEGLAAAPAELSTSAPSHNLESSLAIPEEVTELPAIELAPVLEQDQEQDQTVRKDDQVEPQTLPAEISTSQATELIPEDLQAISNRVEQSPDASSDNTVEVQPALLQEKSTKKEHGSTRPAEEGASTETLDAKPEITATASGASASTAASIEDTVPQSAQSDTRELEADSGYSAQPAPSRAGLPVSELPMEVAASEAPLDTQKDEAVEIPVDPEAPSPPLQDPERFQVKQSSAIESPTTVKNGLRLSVAEAPPATPEPLAESLTTSAAADAQRAVDVKEEQRRRKAERLERYRLEQDRLDEEELEQQRLAKEAKEAAELAQAAESEEQERLEKAKAERDRLEKAELEQQRLEQEAEAKKLLESMEQERLAREAQEEIEAAEAAERALKEAAVKEKEKLEQEQLERDRIELEATARKILEQMELERRAVEAEEAAAAAELAQKEAEAKAKEQREELERVEQSRIEQERIDLERLNQEKLEREAREAAEFAERTQREAEEAEAARIAAEEALHEPILSQREQLQASPTPVHEHESVFESARVSTPRSLTTSPDHVPASAMSDHSPRSHRSPAPEVPKLRTQQADRNYAPKPQAVRQLIEDDRPPAPSPPIGKARPRHVPTFDSDDDSDSALVQTRIASRRAFGGEEGPHQARRGVGPHFASRVPVEANYPNPPNYHPSYYAPPGQPPHYQNHGYGMSQQGYANSTANPYGPSSHSSSSPYQESWSQYPPGYPPYGSPPQRQDSSGSRDYPPHTIEGRPAIENGSGDVFSRIAQTIPDLHVLLARYKETHSQLSIREDLLRRTSAEQQEKLREKDHEIGDLKEKVRNLENKHLAEASRLHFQIGNLEEQVKELREQIAETKKSKKEAEETRLVLDAAMKSWETRYRELEDVHRSLERTSAEEKARAWRDFDEWKSTTNTRHDAEKIALAIQFDKKLKKADLTVEELRHEVAAASELKTELETKLGATQKQLEEALKREQEGREVWLAEQRDLWEAQHKRTQDESDKAWIELHADASKKADEERARADQLLKEKDELLKQHNQLKAENQKEKEIIKSVASNLESEKSRLEKMMECYGDIAEIKSKGDTYYLVSFSQLQKQIIDLASTHFVHLPVRPPLEDLAQVPTNLPSFLGDTMASRQVRAAYVAHTVSKLITYRVFGPFLFSLGRRYDKADSLFSSMSHHIRDKSTRKEAIWRQQTLLAAFTSSGAKQRINTAAGTVVEEIVNAIKHFADPREEEAIKIAVKRIVKLAAETWRFARLEREMITAIMPALQDEEHRFTGPEYWPAYKPEATTIGSLNGTSHPADEQPKLLLRIFPVIYRESKHENFHDNGETRDSGCVFHHGLALYDDAEPVVARMEELKSAGLPSHTTTASLSPADEGKFPPPACPPPRDPLPTPPAPRSPTKTETNTADKASVRSISRPISPTEGSDKTTSSKRASLVSSLNEPTPLKPTTSYPRPATGSMAFTSPRNFIGMPVESLAASQPPSSKKKAPRVDPITEPEEQTPLVPKSRAAVAEAIEAIRHQTSKESAILPPTFSRTTTQETVQEPNTPPDSRAVSPLFEAIDEIESLQPHRTRTSSTSHKRRRSTHTRRSAEHTVEDELPEVNPRTETVRRTSGYASSIRPTKTIDSERTDKSARTEKSDRSDKTERDKSRYVYESRSAAIKALYPNTPLSGQNTNGNSKSSIKSEKTEKKKEKSSKDSAKDSSNASSRDSRESNRESRELKKERSIPDNGTWDTNSEITNDDLASTHISTNMPYPAVKSSAREPPEVKRKPKELRRERSIPDNGTWDTNSEITVHGPATTVSTNVPYPATQDPRRDSKDLKRWSRELSRKQSVSVAGTWDTDSEITHHAPPTTVSTNVPYMTGLPRELRRERSIPDNGTWDTSSEFSHYVAPTTVSTNVPYMTALPRQLRRNSVSDAGTWDTSSDITHRGPPTTVSTNVPYMTELPRQLRRDSISDDGTWDTSSEFTHANDGPATTVSTNIPYPVERPRSLRRRKSIPDNGTWDTSSLVTNEDMKTSVSTNVTYAAERLSR